MNEIAVIAIGRNEGERLVQCLRSASQTGIQLIYVDSDSTDDSVSQALALGAQVIRLDMSKPFSAARARNEGWKAALARNPGLGFIQFVDGDCELEPAWLAAAHQALAEHPHWWAVCGRRRERRPERSIYNAMCDLEWNTPIGQARSVGGDAMFRAAALVATGGYRDDVVAGEEPELCVRIRQQGGEIWRLDLAMTRHDANILHFRQWWTRAKRGGYAYALGSHLHGQPPERHWAKEARRAMVWGLLLPVLIGLSSLWNAWCLLGFSVFAAQWARLAWKSKGMVERPWLYSLFSVLGKFAEAQGGLRWAREQLTGVAPRIIEYK